MSDTPSKIVIFFTATKPRAAERLGAELIDEAAFVAMTTAGGRQVDDQL